MKEEKKIISRQRSKQAQWEMIMEPTRKSTSLL